VSLSAFGFVCVPIVPPGRKQKERRVEDWGANLIFPEARTNLTYFSETLPNIVQNEKDLSLSPPKKKSAVLFLTLCH